MPPPPSLEVLSLTVLLFGLSVPLLAMPPPPKPAALPLIVLLSSVAVPPESLKMPVADLEYGPPRLLDLQPARPRPLR